MAKGSIDTQQPSIQQACLGYRVAAQPKQCKTQDERRRLKTGHYCRVAKDGVRAELACAEEEVGAPYHSAKKTNDTGT